MQRSMNLRCFFLAVIPVVFIPAVQADEAVNKLVAGHEQSVRSAKLPLHRKLLTELQKLQTQYQKANATGPLAEVDAEIARTKEQIAEASQPVGNGMGPQPGDFKILYQIGDAFVFGNWENGTLRMENKGFSWVNNGPMAAITRTRSIPGAFEAQITYTGTVYAFSATEADYTKYVQMFFHPPADDGRHTIELKRTAAGAMTAKVDGNPVTLLPNNGGRPDMIVRLCLHAGKGAKLHLHEMSIKEPAVKK
jgi:hypothetical protein